MSATMDADLLKVRALYGRLENPFWMESPGLWRWRRTEAPAMWQGPGLVHLDSPGLANLLWLSLDLGAPPERYEMTNNPLTVLVLVGASRAQLAGAPVYEKAGVTPLAEFAELLRAHHASDNPLEKAYPLLQLLAYRRMRNA